MPDFENLAVVMHSVHFSSSPACTSIVAPLQPVNIDASETNGPKQT